MRRNPPLRGNRSLGRRKLTPRAASRCSLVAAGALIFLSVTWTVISLHLVRLQSNDPLNLGLGRASGDDPAARGLRLAVARRRRDVTVGADPALLASDLAASLDAMATFGRWRLVDARSQTGPAPCSDAGLPFLHVSSRREARLLRALRDGSPFSWTRMGDGEFNCVLGEAMGSPEQRCTDEVHEMYLNFTSSLGTLPANAFLSPGWWWLCTRPKYDAVRRRMLEGIRGTDVRFSDGFYLATDGNEMDGKYFASHIRDGPVFVVGGRHLRDLGPNLFPHLHLIEVPQSSTAEDLDRTEDEFRAVEKRYRGRIENMKVLVSMGLTAKIFIHRMAREFPQHTFIDTGSSMDHFVGRRSRDYNRCTAKFCERFPNWMKDGLCGTPSDSAKNCTDTMNQAKTKIVVTVIETYHHIKK